MEAQIVTNFLFALGLNQLPYSDCSVVTPTGGLTISTIMHKFKTTSFRRNLRRPQISLGKLRRIDREIWRSNGERAKRVLSLDQNREDFS